MKSTEETKAKAKELGIKSWHVKSEEKLQAEIEQITGETDESSIHNDGSDSSGRDNSGCQRSDEVDKREEAEITVEDLPLEPKLILFSIKALGTKSPYYKYKHLV